MIHIAVRKIHDVVATISRIFSFAGGTPAPEGTGERSSSGDFQERDIPVHACNPHLPTLCQLCNNLEKHNTKYHNPSLQNSIFYSTFLCVSGALISSSCSSICRKDRLTIQGLDKEHQVLLDLKSDGDDPAIARRIAKDPVLRSRENRLRSAIKALIESNEAVRKAF